MPTTRRKRTQPNGSRPGAEGLAATRTDRIRQSIERAIVSGRLPPGAKLDENALAARHGASRTPVREALQQLASQGLIQLRAHAGAFVTTLTLVDLAEMFETMAFLEAACAALAARRHTAEDRQLLSAAHEACRTAAERDDPEAFYAANGRFHECVYAASHNTYLATQTLQLGRRLEAYRREATFHPGLMSLTMTEHERILGAIFGMDEAAAGQQMRSHLDTLRDDAVSMARATRRVARQ
ncbi:MAG TPA: GntR family transcriptional regulator [Casimicrobiaceae bacterium]|nr:GntR family transcriptional regulator [Casimicrobiaceae bacterium]